MKILVVDRDDITRQMMKARLEPLGHQIFEEEVKNNAVARISAERFDVIFLNPSPLTSPRPVVLNIRRSVGSYPYIFLLSDQPVTQEEAIKAGTNDAITKPLDPDALIRKIENAERFIRLVKRIGDDSEDFPSAGGVIAKSAFNQLFLSGIDRADRYGERTYVMFIALSNYREILAMDGQYAADYASAKLSNDLVLMRRQSDIIGQTAKNEYALILQRPIYETEPVEAANRFAESLARIWAQKPPQGLSQPELSVTLVDVPVGSVMAEHVIKPALQIATA